MAKGYIAPTLNIPRDSFDVNVAMEKVDGIDIASVLDLIPEDRETARRLEREAGERAERLAKELKSRRVPLRDIGTILRV